MLGECDKYPRVNSERIYGRGVYKIAIVQQNTNMESSLSLV